MAFSEIRGPAALEATTHGGKQSISEPYWDFQSKASGLQPLEITCSAVFLSLADFVAPPFLEAASIASVSK